MAEYCLIGHVDKFVISWSDTTFLLHAGQLPPLPQPTASEYEEHLQPPANNKP
jgi:hypothetical protein